MFDETKVRPHWKVVAIEETRNWSEDMVARAGRIWGTYLFDQNRHVHCCEITPSYEMHFIESVHSKELNESDSEDFFTADCLDNPSISYFHCRGIDAKSVESFHDFGESTLDNDDDEADLESMLEHVRGNACHPPATWAK